MIFWPSELAEEPERPSQEARVALPFSLLTISGMQFILDSSFNFEGVKLKLKPFISLILFLLFSFSTAFPAEKGFNKGSIILTPVLGLNGFTIPFGASFEYGISRNIGVGGTAMLWFWSNDLWSNTLISLSVDAAYHLTSLKVKKLDLFAGGGLGYSIYSWSWISGCCAVPPGSSGSSG